MSTPKTVHGLFRTVRDAIKAKGCPYTMEYGPAQVPVGVGASRVVWQHDYDTGDTEQPARSNTRNPKMFAVVGVGLLVRIHAQSTLQGAQRHNHEHLARNIAEQVRVEIDKAVGVFLTDYRVTRRGFVPNIDTPEGWQGVTYELRFTVDDSELDVNWANEAADEVSPTIGTTLTATGTPRTDLPSATTRVS